MRRIYGRSSHGSSLVFNQLEAVMAIKFTPEDSAAVAGQDVVFSFPYPITLDAAGAVLGARVSPTGGNALANWSVNGSSILDQPARLVPGQLIAGLVPRILTTVIPNRIIPANAVQRMWLESAPAGANAGQGYFFAPRWAPGAYTAKEFLPEIYVPSANTPGIHVWIDPGDAGTLTLSAGPGSTVTQLVDKINAFAFVQDAAIAVPGHVVGGLNGRDCLNINTSGLICTNAAVASPFNGVNTPWTAAWIVRPAHNTSQRTIMTLGSGSATGDAAIGMGTNLANYTAGRDDSNFAVSAGASSSGDVQTVNPVVLAATFNGSVLDLYVDGILRGRNSSAGFAQSLSNSIMAIGMRRHLATPTGYWSNTGARIGEGIISTQALGGAPANIGEAPTVGSDIRRLIDYLRVNAGQI